MDKKRNTLLNWGLWLGIASIFFGGDFFILPLSAMIVSYISLIEYDSGNKNMKKGIVGFVLGVLYFLTFLYRNEMNSMYPSETAFMRQAGVFLITVAIFAYILIKQIRRNKDFEFIPLSEYNLNDYTEKQPSTSHDEILDTINKLSKMLNEGILTQEEFDSKKKELLSRL